MKRYLLGALLCVAMLGGLPGTSRAGLGLLFKDNFNTIAGTYDINPDLSNDAVGRQTGSLANLFYTEDPNHVSGGSRDNMTQLNNPDFPDALLLAPSNTFGFESTVYVEPLHNFVEDPEPGNKMVIFYDANPVHDTYGVQLTDEAPIVARFAHGLEFLLYDGGKYEFFSPGLGLINAGDLEPLDPGGAGGLFAGFHSVRIELLADDWTMGTDLDVQIFVDNDPVEIDSDGTPTLFETTMQSPIPPGTGPPTNFINISADADPDGPTAGTVEWTLHGIDNFVVSIAVIPEPTALGLLLIGSLALLRRRR